MRCHAGKIFSKKFNISMLVIFIAFFCSFSIFVNMIALSNKNEHRASSLNIDRANDVNVFIKNETVCLNGFLFNSVNGKVTSEVFEKEDDPVYLVNGGKIITSKTRVKC